MVKNYKFNRIAFFALSLFLFIIFVQGAIWENKKENQKTNDLKVNIEKKDTPKDTKQDALQETTEDTEEQESADTVKIGAYVLSIYDLNFPGNKVNVDFYLWYNAKKDSLDLLRYLEVVNSTEFSKSGETDERREDIIYQTVRINSQIREEWDVSNFPFDRQNIEVIIEDFDKDNSKLVFVADTIGSKLDKSVHLDGWVIKDFGIKVVDNTYETSYGDPALKLNEYSTYSRAIIYLTIEREGNGLFFKLFIGLFISVLISLITFFINPLDLDPRFGLSVGAIFAAIASQYVIASTLPQNAKLMLVDKLHDIAFIYIFLCILVSTVSLHYMKNEKGKLSQKIDRTSFYVLAATYTAFVLYFVINALS